MAVFRVEKNSGYTVMSNHHLRNRALSLKAKGLLSQMLSLPEDWDYTLQGLARINRESIDAIRQAIRELEQAGYIQRSRERDEKGRLRGADYVIFELPQPIPASVSPTLENPTLENPTQENPTLENPMQLNKDKLITEKQKKEGLLQTTDIPLPARQRHRAGNASPHQLQLRCRGAQTGTPALPDHPHPERRHHGSGHPWLSGGLGASHAALYLYPGDGGSRKSCSADHLPGLCGLRHLHHLFRRAGGSGQGHAVVGDLPVPLHRLHHAAGLGALPTVWPCGRLERVLGHGSALRHRFPYRLQKERLTRFPYTQKRLRACTPLSQGGKPGAFSVSAQGLVFIWCAARCSGRPIQSAYPVPPRGQRSFWPYACGSASVRGMLPPAARLPCRRRAPRAGCPWAQRP